MAKDDLVGRLLKVESSGEGITTNWYRNPDGPEAVAYIRELERQLGVARVALEQAAADFDEHANFAQTRIEDGEELGASVWRIALGDVKREAIENASRARTALADIEGKDRG